MTAASSSAIPQASKSLCEYGRNNTAVITTTHTTIITSSTTIILAIIITTINPNMLATSSCGSCGSVGGGENIIVAVPRLHLTSLIHTPAHTLSHHMYGTNTLAPCAGAGDRAAHECAPSRAAHLQVPPAASYLPPGQSCATQDVSRTRIICFDSKSIC